MRANQPCPGAMKKWIDYPPGGRCPECGAIVTPIESRTPRPIGEHPTAATDNKQSPATTV